jgi:hypothetical protein
MPVVGIKQPLTSYFAKKIPFVKHGREICPGKRRLENFPLRYITEIM